MNNMNVHFIGIGGIGKVCGGSGSLVGGYGGRSGAKGGSIYGLKVEKLGGLLDGRCVPNVEPTNLSSCSISCSLCCCCCCWFVSSLFTLLTSCFGFIVLVRGGSGAIGKDRFVD